MCLETVNLRVVISLRLESSVCFTQGLFYIVDEKKAILLEGMDLIWRITKVANETIKTFPTTQYLLQN